MFAQFTFSTYILHTPRRVSARCCRAAVSSTRCTRDVNTHTAYNIDDRGIVYVPHYTNNGMCTVCGRAESSSAQRRTCGINLSLFYSHSPRVYSLHVVRVQVVVVVFVLPISLLASEAVHVFMKVHATHTYWAPRSSLGMREYHTERERYVILIQHPAYAIRRYRLAVLAGRRAQLMVSSLEGIYKTNTATYTHTHEESTR